MYSFSTCNSPFIETYRGRTSLNSLPVLFPVSRRTGVNASKTAKTGDVPVDWMVHLPITSATMRSMDSAAYRTYSAAAHQTTQKLQTIKSFTRFFSKNRRGPGGSAPCRASQGAKHPPVATGETPLAGASPFTPRTSNRRRWARARCPCPPEAPVRPRGCGGQPWRE